MASNDVLWLKSWELRRERKLYPRRLNVDRLGNKICSGCTVIDYNYDEKQPQTIKLEWSRAKQAWMFFFKDQYYIYPTLYNWMNQVNVFNCEIVKEKSK